MSGMAQQQAVQPDPNFEGNTRLLRIPMEVKAKTTDGQLLSWQTPRNGFLRGIIVPVELTITGAPGTPNPIGQSVYLRQVRFYQNGGNVLFDMSGPGIHYGLNEMLELGQNIGSYTTGRSAVAATTTGRIDFYIPISPNLRDAVGLLNLQTEQNTFSLDIQFETDLISGGAVAVSTASVSPMMEVFTVPDSEYDYPSDMFLQRIYEESITYTTSTEQTYTPLRGDQYLQLCHLIGADLVTPSDKFSTANIRVNQSSFIQTAKPVQLDVIKAHESLTTRRAGMLLYDFLGSAGLGNYDKMRDVINTKRVTDFQSRFTLNTSPVTVRTIRRMLATVGQ